VPFFTRLRREEELVSRLRTALARSRLTQTSVTRRVGVVESAVRFWQLSMQASCPPPRPAPPRLASRCCRHSYG
jgi:hypothetical protein